MTRVIISFVVYLALAGTAWAEYKDIVQLAGDGDRVFFLRKNGNILVEDAGGTRIYDSGTRTTRIAVDGAVVYKDDGKLWRRIGESGWQKIDDGGGNRRLLARARSLYVLKADGKVWRFSDDKWTLLDAGQKIFAGAESAVVSRGKRYTLDHGRIVVVGMPRE